MEEKVPIGQEEFARFVRAMTSFLNERDRRVFLGGLQEVLGPGYQGRLAEMAGVSSPTVAKGRAEYMMLAEGDHRARSGTVRARGGGRKSVEDTDPELVRMVLQVLVEEPGASSRRIQAVLEGRGRKISHVTVRRLVGQYGGDAVRDRSAGAAVSGPDDQIN